MHLPLSWIREYVDLPEPASVIAERLDLTGTAVEAVHAGSRSLDGLVVVGRVLKVEKHPDADRLTYDEVDVGTHVARIVCGAPNVEVGMAVPVALPGATLPGGARIERRTVRGLESEGMMCAEDELGLGGDHSGIMALDASLAPGTPLDEALGEGEPVLELEITPNRPDCLSIRGLARELGAVFGRDVTYPEHAFADARPEASQSAKVDIEDPEGCPRYVAMVIEGITVGPSPDWLASRITAMGARPINNVVDVTNYVMFEMGQPLHAFDMDRVADGHIIVRRARQGERITTLDGVHRELTTDMLAICDPSGPIALAGVMGGASTEVGDATTRILLESANFDPPLIMRTSRGLGLLSDASARFEKGVDPNGCLAAARRAAALMAELGGGTVRAGAVDVYPSPRGAQKLTMRPGRVARIMGMEIGEKTMADLLTRLGLEVSLAHEPGSGAVLTVTVPTFRPDLEREIDLVEEVARLVGYNEVPSTLPRGAGHVGTLTASQRAERRLGELLRAGGLSEALSMGFADPADVTSLRWPSGEGENLVKLVNPLGSDQSALRPTILVDLIRAVRRNQSVGEREIALYESGRVWPGRREDGIPVEERRVGLVMAGAWQGRAWHSPAEPFDIYDLVGVLEDVRDGLRLAGFAIEATDHPSLMPGRASTVLAGGRVAGIAGQLHPEVAAAFEVDGPVFVTELDLGVLDEAAFETREFVSLGRFPAVERDLAVVVASAVPVGELVAAATEAGEPLLADVAIFDLYRGPGIASDKKSVGLGLRYRAAERTLSDLEVDGVHAAVEKALAERFGAVRR